MKRKLNEENINISCEEADSFLRKRKTDSKDRIRTMLSMEETLLKYKDSFGTDSEYIVDFGSGFHRNRIRLTVPGRELDPFSPSGFTSDEERFMQGMLTRLGQVPKWKYKRGANIIDFTLEKHHLPEWEKLVFAIVFAAVLGFLIRLLPQETATLMLEEIISPLLNTFLGFLNAVAGPMIFLSVVWGIYNIGDASTFSEIGKHICMQYGIYLSVMTILVVFMSLPFYNLLIGSSETANEFSVLYRMVLDIVPSNLFTPFSRGNTLQILFVAVIVGVTLLLIGKDTQSVADLSEQLGFVVNGIMSGISMLVPFFVFGSLLNIIASSDLNMLAAGGKFFAGALLGCVVLMLMHTAITCIRMKISPMDLWKRTLSSFVIAITTASSSAVFADNIKTCTEKLGVSKRLADFGVPFGQILYKPGVSVLFWFAAISVAESEGTEVSLAWFITATAICIILSAAAPPVPGGMTASFTILFTQLSLPVSNIAIILSLTSVLDFIVTATNIFTGQCVLALASRGLEHKQSE